MLHSFLSLPLTTTTTVAAGVLTAVAAGFYVVWCSLKKKLESKKPFPNLPMPPDSHWLLGHILTLGQGGNFQKANEIIALNHANQDGLTGYWLATEKAVAVANWKDARAVLFATYYRKGADLLNHHLARVFGKKNIGMLKGREWKFHRVAIQKAFSPKAMADYAHRAMKTVLDTVTASLKARESSSSSLLVVDMEEICKMITMDIFCLSALSDDKACCCKTLETSPFVEALEFMTVDVMRRLYNPFSFANNLYFIPTELNKRFNDSCRLTRNYLEGLVEQRRKLPRSEERPKDLLNFILAAHEEEAQKQAVGGCGNDEDVSTAAVDDETIGDMLITLLFAGYDTTAVTLTYVFYVLATKPHIQAMVHEEVKQFGTNDMDKLAYTRAVLMETLRIYPVADHTARNLEKDIELSGGVVIPKGTFVMVAIWIIQRNQEYFPRPLEFIPERWAIRQENRNGVAWKERREDDDDIAKEQGVLVPPGNHKAMLVFSAGARNCPGQKFAMEEAMMVIARLVDEFQFDLADKSYKLQSIKDGLVCKPKGGLPLVIKSRR